MTREALIAALVGLAVFTSLAHGDTKKNGHVGRPAAYAATKPQVPTTSRKP